LRRPIQIATAVPAVAVARGAGSWLMTRPMLMQAGSRRVRTGPSTSPTRCRAAGQPSMTCLAITGGRQDLEHELPWRQGMRPLQPVTQVRHRRHLRFAVAAREKKPERHKAQYLHTFSSRGATRLTVDRGGILVILPF
jgi:hypothetical protein